MRAFTHGKRILAQNRRTQLHATDQGAAFQEELQLRHRQLQIVGRAVPPQAGEATRLLESLRVHTEARPVPEKHLGALPRTVDEQEQITGQGVAAQALAHQSGEPFKALPHVCRGRVGKHADLPAAPDHRCEVTISTAVATSTPSIAQPLGLTTRTSVRGRRSS